MKIKKIKVAEIELENGETFIAELEKNQEETAEIVRRNNHFEPFEVSFMVTIKETPGALNTAKKIAELLEKAEIEFGVHAISDLPGIWASVGDKKSAWVATYDPNGMVEDRWQFEGYGGWKTVRAFGRQDGDPCQPLFGWLTKPARRLVDTWIHGLCDEYEKRINSDVPAHDPDLL